MVALAQMPPAMAPAGREAPVLGTPLASRGRGLPAAAAPSNGSGQHRTEPSAPASKPSSGQQLPPMGPLQHMTLEDLEPLDGEGGRSLGKGSFGVVRRVRLRRGPANDLFALKSMQKREVMDSDLVDQVEREIAFQSCMQHENVLRLYKHFEDAEAVYLLLEFCAKGELYQLLRTRRGRRFTETVAQHYFVQVTRGLRYLHSQQIVHRDLKPENLLVNQDDVLKIADFGWCAKTTEPRNTFCGTLDYLAPEMIMQRGHNHTLDVWSVGVLLYEMVVGRPPFQSTNHQLLINKIMSIELRYPPFVPPGVADLVGRLLRMDPNERLPLDEVLRHPWVTTTHSAATSPGPQREASCSPTPTDNIQRRLHPQQLHLVTAGAAAAAAASMLQQDAGIGDQQHSSWGRALLVEEGNESEESENEDEEAATVKEIRRWRTVSSESEKEEEHTASVEAECNEVVDQSAVHRPELVNESSEQPPGSSSSSGGCCNGGMNLTADWCLARMGTLKHEIMQFKAGTIKVNKLEEYAYLSEWFDGNT
mmetsp:Transcript_121533/g.236460  ORF Transcript_121533/g.236460 Transcript_121533/m.236460 type:complete len:534 (-) Transcript_121533:150-1751(-)